MTGYPGFDGICISCGLDEYVCHCENRRIVSTADYLAWEKFRGGMVARHRARREAGAHLDPGYERAVHHVDGNPYDNDPANLVVMDPKEGGQ